MKNTNLLFGLVIALLVFTFSSCSNEDGGIITPQSTTDAPDMTENGANPDEAAITEETDHSRSGYIYTQSNAAAQNSVLFYKQHGNGTLSLEATVPSGGNGSGTGLGNQGALAIKRMVIYFSL